MTENWFHNDPNYHYNLRVALTVQDVLVELRDLLKAKQEMIKNFAKTNDPRLTFADFEEEKRLIKQIQDFSGNFNPF
jgi:Mg2+ and Co2+ transporter CorA